jgi:hypothetical protein
MTKALEIGRFRNAVTTERKATVGFAPPAPETTVAVAVERITPLVVVTAPPLVIARAA